MVGTGNLATVHQLPIAGRPAWDFETDGFMAYLRTRRRSPATITAYTYALRRFRESMEAHGRDLNPAGITGRDVMTFQADMIAAGDKPASQASRYAAVRSWCHWLMKPAQAVLEADPFAGLEAPTIPESLVPVVPPADVEAILAATSGRSFLDRRDHALVAFMVDSGVRREEVTNMFTADLDLEAGMAVVHGKGERVRVVRFGDRAQVALRSYLRVRAAHKRAAKVETRGRADNPRRGTPLWLGDARTGRGGIGTNTVQAILRARAAEAHVPHIHPHQLRHTWADGLKANGTTDGDLMALGGWRSPRMLDRYGKAEASRRAVVNYRSPLDAMAKAKGR